MADNGPRPERLSEDEIRPKDLKAGQMAAFLRDVDRLLSQSEAFVSVSCPACKGKNAAPAFEKYGFSYSECPGCRTLFMNPRPTPEIMNSYYTNSENYRYWAEHIFPASEASRREKIHRPRLERLQEYCRRHSAPGGTLVEVGPGFGTFAALARDSGFFDRVLVVETTPELARHCRERGLTVIEKRVEEVGDEIRQADALAAFEVLEHLFEPAVFLERCGTLLRPGGLLVVSCPNGLGFDVSVLGERSSAVDPEHVNLFNPKSLSHMLSQQGFKVLEVATPGRLDAELVRNAALEGDLDLGDRPFLRRVLIDDWEDLGWPFQRFLADNGLSSHMWAVAAKI
ncbi:MAG: class I SAM-dependent methyltransferase [Desulfovibrionaceae bacterium]|nr:class I SAM-dependent methyltransferase [Desulfovibrionaceae bacterium]